MQTKDVTDLVSFGNNDDECLPVNKCVCGHEFRSWDFIISIYEDDPYMCRFCGAKLFFENGIRIYQVIE
jgi:DNA-directed RNA polymerase subunit RPC12/RpoP